MADSWAFLGRCTMEARRAVFHARQAVTEFGGTELSPEHLLWGLLSTDVLASRHLTGLPMSEPQLRHLLRGLIQSPTGPARLDVPLTPAAAQVFDRAWSEADSLGHSKVRSEHVLIGLLSVGTAGAELLKQNGVSEGVVRSGISADDPDESEH